MTIIEDDLTNDIIEAFREKVRQQAERIKELEEGSCRFNCRTQKQAYFAGFDAGMDQGVHWNDRHEAYEAFRQQIGEGG